MCLLPILAIYVHFLVISCPYSAPCLLQAQEPPDRAFSDEPRAKSKVSVGEAALKCGVWDCFIIDDARPHINWAIWR